MPRSRTSILYCVCSHKFSVIDCRLLRLVLSWHDKFSVDVHQLIPMTCSMAVDRATRHRLYMTTGDVDKPGGGAAVVAEIELSYLRQRSWRNSTTAIVEPFHSERGLQNTLRCSCLSVRYGNITRESLSRSRIDCSGLLSTSQKAFNNALSRCQILS